MTNQVKVKNFPYVFWIAAFLLGVLAFEIVWWQVLILILLANSNFKITYSK